MSELGNHDSESWNPMESYDTKGRDWSIPTFCALFVGIDHSRHFLSFINLQKILICAHRT